MPFKSDQILDLIHKYPSKLNVSSANQFIMDAVGALLLMEIEDDEDELWLLMQRRILQLRSRSYVTTSGLLKPTGSPWCKLYEYGDDMHFINLTSLNRTSF